MATFRTRFGMLIADFRYHGKRCREKTNLKDTPENRKKLKVILKQIEAEILLGSFDYMAYFPKSDRATEMVALNNRVNACQSSTPLFKEFVELWFEEKKLNGDQATKKSYK